MQNHLKVPTWITDKRLTPSDIKVVLHIVELACFKNPYYRGKEIYTSIVYSPTEWSKLIPMSKTTIIKAIKSLVEYGFVKRVDNCSYMIEIIWE